MNTSIHVSLPTGMCGCWSPVDFHVLHHRFAVVADVYLCYPAVANPLHFVGRFVIHLFRMDGCDNAANGRKRN